MARAILTAKDLLRLPFEQGIWGYWLGTYLTVPTALGWEIADGGVSVNDPTYTKPSLCHGKFPRTATLVGDAVGGGVGAASHTHTIPSHSHSSSSTSGSAGTPCGGSGSNCSSTSHTHSVSSDGGGSSSSATNNPLNTSGIPIVYCKKGGGARGIVPIADLSADALPPWKITFGWHSNAAVPAGWAKCDGSTVNSVVLPNLLQKYLKGVAATGNAPADGGGTYGATHTHDATHGHSASNGSGSVAVGNGCTGIDSGHTHTLSATAVTTGTGTIDPEGVTTHWVCFTGHGTNAAANTRGRITSADLAAELLAPRGLTGIWTVSNTPPTKWAHCDGGAWANGTPTGYGASKPSLLDRMIKHVANATTNGGVADATSSDSHSHTAGSHSHTLQSACCDRDAGDGTYNHPANCNHSHTSGAPSFSGLGVGTSSIPAHWKIAWIVRD